MLQQRLFKGEQDVQEMSTNKPDDVLDLLYWYWLVSVSFLVEKKKSGIGTCSAHARVNVNFNGMEGRLTL